jgi:hypothetical protein
MTDTVEFYRDKSAYPFLTIESSFAPVKGDLVNIIGQTWKVLGRSFTVDHGDDPMRRAMRCNVIVRAADKPSV